MCIQLGRWAWIALVFLTASTFGGEAAKKDEPKKPVPAVVPDGLRVSLSTHLPEIKKRLADKSPATRRTAMQLLAEVRRDESGPILLDLALFDDDPEIRMEAFSQLCLFPDIEGKISHHLSQVFRKEPSPWVKQGMALNMTRLPFKHSVISELVYYIVAMRDPDNTIWDDQYDSQGRLGGGGGKGRGRDHFSLIVQALNSASGRNFPANRDTAIQVAEWWKVNEFDYKKYDSDLALKLKKEGIVGLNLAPNSTPRPTAETAKAEEAAHTKKQGEQATKGGKELAGILGEDEEDIVRKPDPNKAGTKSVTKKSDKPASEDDIE